MHYVIIVIFYHVTLRTRFVTLLCVCLASMLIRLKEKGRIQKGRISQRRRRHRVIPPSASSWPHSTRSCPQTSLAPSIACSSTSVVRSTTSALPCTTPEGMWAMPCSPSVGPVIVSMPNHPSRTSASVCFVSTSGSSGAGASGASSAIRNGVPATGSTHDKRSATWRCSSCRTERRIVERTGYMTPIQSVPLQSPIIHVHI